MDKLLFGPVSMMPPFFLPLAYDMSTTYSRII
jgi:hypothetical protein